MHYKVIIFTVATPDCNVSDGAAMAVVMTIQHVGMQCCQVDLMELLESQYAANFE